MENENLSQSGSKRKRNKVIMRATFLLTVIFAVLAINHAINLFFLMTKGPYEEVATIEGHGTKKKTTDGGYLSVSGDWEKIHSTVKVTYLTTNKTNAYAVVEGDLGSVGETRILYACRKPFLSGDLSRILRQTWTMDVRYLKSNEIGSCIVSCVFILILYVIRRKVDPNKERRALIKRIYHYYHYY